MARILLAGESWISQSTHYKGFDSFSSTTFHTGADAFIAAAGKEGIEIDQIYAHDVPQRFPHSQEELGRYDVVILSDIGCNSFVLPPETWLAGQKAPNPLVELATWTRNGGGLMMAGGYLSFQGFQARANFARSPIAPVLPVEMLDSDDRAEVPEGGRCELVASDHPIGRVWKGQAPDLLGYNVVTARAEADVVAKVNGDVLIATWQVEQGRSLVWTSDIGPHWCPEEFLGWDCFAPVVGAMLRWLGAGGDA